MHIPHLLLSAALLGGWLLPASAQSPLLRDSMPATWQMTPQNTVPSPESDPWWETFGDSTLTALINKAVANNYDVSTALKRVEIARMAVKEAESGYYPTLGASAGWNKGRSSGEVVPGGMPSTTSSFNIGANASWEIDVFGRVYASAKESKEAVKVSRADYEAVLLSLCAELATDYFTLRQCQIQKAVADAHIASQKRVVGITEARFEAELADMLDVTQARVVLYGTQASLPSLEAQIRTLVNSISLLCGEYPGPMAAELLKPAPMPEAKLPSGWGVPADLLRRRPDVVEAEMTVGQMAAAVGVAKKNFLPTLALTASAGTEAHRGGDLFGHRSLYWSVAPTLSWTLFDGLARNYRTAAAKLQMENAVDSYNQTVMGAVAEVNTAMMQYEATLEGLELQKKVVEESEKAVRLSVDLYKAGLTAFNNVVDGQMSWLENQNSLVTLQGKALTTLVSLYKALGGGF